MLMIFVKSIFPYTNLCLLFNYFVISCLYLLCVFFSIFFSILFNIIFMPERYESAACLKLESS